MLPFLKNKEASVASNAEDEPTLRRKSDDGEPFEMIDAIVEDMIEGVHKKDKSLLKSALEALCEHIQDMDAVQDESLTNEEL